jgi:hypothetical protein
MRDLVLAQQLHIDHGAQRAADQALDFLGAAALLACRGFARVRDPVARGSMPYSAVTQPWPLPRSQPGRLVSTEAVTNTLVAERDEAGLPSALGATLRSSVTARIWLGSRPEGPHMIKSLVLGNFY